MAAESKNFDVSILIRIQDMTAQAVSRVKSGIGSISAPLSRGASSFSNFAARAGGAMTTAAEATKEAGQKISAFGNKIESETKAIGMRIMGLATAIGATFMGLQEGAQSVARNSEKIGITTKEFQRLAYAANQADIEQEAFAGAMMRFSRNIGEASLGNQAMIETFTRMGVSVRDVYGRIRPTSDIFYDVADALGRMQDPALRTAATLELFGRGGANMVLMLKNGSKDVRKFGDELEKAGGLMSEESIQKAEALETTMKRLKATSNGLLANAFAPLAEKVVQIVEKLQKWAEANKELIKSAIGKVIESAAKFAEGFWQSIQKVYEWISKLAEFLGLTSDRAGSFAETLGRAIPILLAVAAGIKAIGLATRLVAVVMAGSAVVMKAFGLGAAGVAAASGAVTTAMTAQAAATTAANTALAASGPAAAAAGSRLGALLGTLGKFAAPIAAIGLVVGASDDPFGFQKMIAEQKQKDFLANLDKATPTFNQFDAAKMGPNLPGSRPLNDPTNFKQEVKSSVDLNVNIKTDKDSTATASENDSDGNVKMRTSIEKNGWTTQF